MMDEKERIARKLAEITGRPITEFFNGTIAEEKIEREDSSPTQVSDTDNVDTPEIGSDQEEPISKTVPKIKESHEVTEELLEYQKMFAGSKIVKKVILGGRQMTKKEYNKFTKGLTYEEFYKHPLMYKMFRSEGQLDPSWMTFPERFKNGKK